MQFEIKTTTTTRLWYIIILSVYKHNERYYFYQLTHIRSHGFFKFSMALGCFSPLLFLKYISYIVKIGGGGYVVKTYPSIDPIAAPPDIVDIHVTWYLRA